MKIYYAVLAQILRHFFTLAAGILGAVGVMTDMQSELVETTITIVVPIILLLISQGWSYLQKRHFPELLKAAFEANPEYSDIETVKLEAKSNSKAPVIY